MTRDELNNAYFDWMYQLVCDDEYSRGLVNCIRQEVCRECKEKSNMERYFQ